MAEPTDTAQRKERAVPWRRQQLQASAKAPAINLATTRRLPARRWPPARQAVRSSSLRH